MDQLVRSRAVVTAMVAGLWLTGCAGMHSSQSTAQRPQMAQGALTAGDRFILITDTDGNLLGGAAVKVTPDTDIVIKRSDIILPQDVTKVTIGPTTFASAFKDITIFKTSNPGCWANQAGLLIRLC
jgi:hypothetical protein